MRISVSCQLYLVKVLVSVSIAAGFQHILSLEIMVVEECFCLFAEHSREATNLDDGSSILS